MADTPLGQRIDRLGLPAGLLLGAAGGVLAGVALGYLPGWAAVVGGGVVLVVAAAIGWAGRPIDGGEAAAGNGPVWAAGGALTLAIAAAGWSLRPMPPPDVPDGGAADADVADADPPDALVDGGQADAARDAARPDAGPIDAAPPADDAAPAPADAAPAADAGAAPTLEQVRALMDAWDLEGARAALQRLPKSAQTVALGKALGALDREVVRWQASLTDARADLRAGRPKEARQQAFALMNELVIRGYPLLGDFARKALALYVEADAAERARSLESLLQYAQKAVASGDLQRAQALYRKAVAVDGTHAGAHAGLGRVALLSGQHAAAVEHLGVAVRLAPEQPEYRVLLSMALRALERSAEADAYLQQALGTNSLALEARRRLSRDAERLGQKDVVQRLEPRAAGER